MYNSKKALKSDVEILVQPLVHLLAKNRRQEDLIVFQKAIMKALSLQVKVLFRMVKSYAREIERLRKQPKKQRK